jgi:hypothetical protein
MAGFSSEGEGAIVRPRIIPPLETEDDMEADEINVIANTLADIAQRTAELRRYL